VVKQQELVDAQKDLVKAQQKLSCLEDQQNKFTALLQIFQLLDNNAHRNARRRIIDLYTDESNTDKWDTLKRMNVTKEEHINENFINSNYLESREIVKADFNQIEALIKSGLSPEEFLKSYWLEVLKCYKALEDYRDERSMEYFNDLMKRAEEYRKTHHNKVSPPQTMSKDKFKENFRDV
jgi:hypothetical protein